MQNNNENNKKKLVKLSKKIKPRDILLSRIDTNRKVELNNNEKTHVLVNYAPSVQVEIMKFLDLHDTIALQRTNKAGFLFFSSAKAKNDTDDRGRGNLFWHNLVKRYFRNTDSDDNTINTKDGYDNTINYKKLFKLLWNKSFCALQNEHECFYSLTPVLQSEPLFINLFADGFNHKHPSAKSTHIKEQLRVLLNELENKLVIFQKLAEKNGYVIQLADENIRLDVSLVLIALAHNHRSIDNFPEEVLKKYQLMDFDSHTEKDAKIVQLAREFCSNSVVDIVEKIIQDKLEEKNKQSSTNSAMFRHTAEQKSCVMF